MVVHEAAREAYLAATNAVLGATTALPAEVSPIGSFTDPEYASVGLTETTARKTHEVVVATQRFDSLPRPIIDGRPTGFCKLIADRQLHTILGCHIVGERAVELAQLAAIAIAAKMTVEQLALVPFSFPTYANALGRAAIKAARELDIHAAPAEDRLPTQPKPPHSPPELPAPEPTTPHPRPGDNGRTPPRRRAPDALEPPGRTARKRTLPVLPAAAKPLPVRPCAGGRPAHEASVLLSDRRARRPVSRREPLGSASVRRPRHLRSGMWQALAWRSLG